LLPKIQHLLNGGTPGFSVILTGWLVASRGPACRSTTGPKGVLLPLP